MTKLSAAETLAGSRLKSVNLTLPAVAMSGIGTGTVSTFVFGVSSVWARLPKTTWISAGWMWGPAGGVANTTEVPRFTGFGVIDPLNGSATIVTAFVPVTPAAEAPGALNVSVAFPAPRPLIDTGGAAPGWEGDHTHRVPHTPHRAHDAGRPVRGPRDREAGVHDWRVGDRGQRHDCRRADRELYVRVHGITGAVARDGVGLRGIGDRHVASAEFELHASRGAGERCRGVFLARAGPDRDGQDAKGFKETSFHANLAEW